MKKSTRIRTIVYLLSVILAVFGIFLIWRGHVKQYFSNRILTGVWVNGEYATGLTCEELESKLLQQKEYRSYQITGLGDREVMLTLGPGELRTTYGDQVRNLRKDRKGGKLFGKEEHITLVPAVELDRNAIAKRIASLDFFRNPDKALAGEVYIYSEDGQYRLADETHGLFDYEGAKLSILEGILSETEEINVSDYRYDAEYTEEMLQTIQLFDSLASIQNRKILLHFGDVTEELTGQTLLSLFAHDSEERLMHNEAGMLIVDSEAIEAYADALSARFDTWGKARTVTTHDGFVLEYEEGGTYGNLMDLDSLKEFLKEAIASEEPVLEYTPTYLKKAVKQGEEDLGNEWVEINMTRQKLYVVKDNEVLFETDIVTGNLRKGRGTPVTLCRVEGKYRNRILRGADYESFVQYWVPITHENKIGIHDADWRKKFGGKIYKTNGSHGCVNIPPQNMVELYDLLFKGEPVFLFFEPETVSDEG